MQIHAIAIPSHSKFDLNFFIWQISELQYANVHLPITQMLRLPSVQNDGKDSLLCSGHFNSVFLYHSATVSILLSWKTCIWYWILDIKIPCNKSFKSSSLEIVSYICSQLKCKVWGRKCWLLSVNYSYLLWMLLLRNSTTYVHFWSIWVFFLSYCDRHYKT